MTFVHKGHVQILSSGGTSASSWTRMSLGVRTTLSSCIFNGWYMRMCARRLL